MATFRLKISRADAAGPLMVGIAVAISSVAIVRAEHAAPNGSVTYTCSTGKACVEGNSTGSETWGVYGAATALDGVHGTTNSTGGHAGIAGISTNVAGSGKGVYGSSKNGSGVYGTSSVNNGIGVEGHAKGGTGVAGYGVTGVYGNSPGDGVYGETTYNGAGVYALSDTSTASIFYGLDNATGGQCNMDAKANLKCTGSIRGHKTVQVSHTNAAGQQVLAYASESAAATIEDAGTARLVSGVATVQISPDFASLMDRGWYYVFVAPLGDSRGLYVSAQTLSAFQVRENERGRDTLAFNYRIIARPRDGSRARLPNAPPMERPSRLRSMDHD